MVRAEGINMENQEDVLDALCCYEKKPTNEIPPVLEQYLRRVAKTGETLFPWQQLKILFIHKLDHVITQFNQDFPADHLQNCPNVENVKVEEMKKRVVCSLEEFQGAPFTIQRLCELVTEPKKHYKRSDKFLRGIEKNVLVVSTVDPYGRKIVSDSRPMVNGLDMNGYNGDKTENKPPHFSTFPSAQQTTWPSEKILSPEIIKELNSADFPEDTCQCQTSNNKEDISASPVDGVEQTNSNTKSQLDVTSSTENTVKSVVNPDSLMVHSTAAATEERETSLGPQPMAESEEMTKNSLLENRTEVTKGSLNEGSSSNSCDRENQEEDAQVSEDTQDSDQVSSSSSSLSSSSSPESLKEPDDISVKEVDSSSVSTSDDSGSESSTHESSIPSQDTASKEDATSITQCADTDKLVPSSSNSTDTSETQSEEVPATSSSLHTDPATDGGNMEIDSTVCTESITDSEMSENKKIESQSNSESADSCEEEVKTECRNISEETDSVTTLTTPMEED